MQPGVGCSAAAPCPLPPIPDPCPPIPDPSATMLRLAWLTDLHLNFVGPQVVVALAREVRLAGVDGVLLGGDIGEANDVRHLLGELALELELPVYFVLGNHDFYRGSFAGVRGEMAQLGAALPNLRYLTTEGVIELTPQTALVGHDGWADARVGDYDRSDVMLNDYRLIRELAGATKAERRRLLEQLGDEAADHVRRQLTAAAAKYSRVILLTHVPPLREACWHRGEISDDEWAPHFTCLAVGHAILEVMAQFSDCRLTVLCGHTHSPGECRPRENVVIYTGGAQYGRPEVQRVVEVE